MVEGGGQVVRQTDRQWWRGGTGCKTDRQTDSGGGGGQVVRQTDRQTVVEGGGQVVRQTDRQT